MKTASFLSSGYYDLLRPEIFSLIPEESKKILDLGCGTGKLGEHIKKRQKCYYGGIEINRAAAQLARKRIDAVVHADLDDTTQYAVSGPIDCLICADILEHLKDPWHILKRHTDILSENGVVIASIPNIAYQGIINDLQRGLFRYVPAGILDRSHLRFFTLTSIFQMFSGLDLKIVHIYPSPSVDNPIQWIIKAKKAKFNSRQPSTAIVIPSFNNLAMLQSTIKSIRAQTTLPYKIIVVNNASADGTNIWLQNQEDLLEIRNQANLGFTTANNIVLEITNTPYVVLANDDIVVTDGWLNGLIECTKKDPKIGIVGPMSNYVSGPQMDRHAKYQNEQELHLYAAKIKKESQGRTMRFPRIVFFCTLIKREVIQKIGLLDERFNPGNFEDDDYCLRAKSAGFINVIDQSVFVHHYGSTSWKKDPQKYRALLERNKQLLLQKWPESELKGLYLSS